jgi:hypothetical protein
MQARELIELAGLVSAHGPLLIEGRRPVTAEQVESYWVASKTRFDCWARSLKAFADGGRASNSTWPEGAGGGGHPGPVSFSAPHGRPAWQHLRGVLEEILLSEVLTRVWTAVLCACDRRHGADDAGPAARSVLLGHMEARHRGLRLVIQAGEGRGPAGAGGTEDRSSMPEWSSGRQRRGAIDDAQNGPAPLSAALPLEAAVKLNGLRRRAERWTDVLVGHLAAAEKATGGPPGRRPSAGDRERRWPLHQALSFSVLEFAADPGRASDFAEDLRCRGAPERRRFAWPLLLASLRGAFQRGIEGPSPNAELNARIAASIVACFPAELFDGTGLFHRVWMLRLMNVADDAQGMIDQLLSPQRDDHPWRGRNGGI